MPNKRSEREKEIEKLKNHFNDQRLELLELFARVTDVLRYCEPHLDQMWAATIVAKLLDGDFRDAKADIDKFFGRTGG